MIETADVVDHLIWRREGRKIENVGWRGREGRRERGRGRERERERETDRQTDRRTERQRACFT